MFPSSNTRCSTLELGKYASKTKIIRLMSIMNHVLAQTCDKRVMTFRGRGRTGTEFRRGGIIKPNAPSSSSSSLHLDKITSRCTHLILMAVQGVQILSNAAPESQTRILTNDALKFLAALHRTFEPTRQSLLKARQSVQKQLDSGGKLDFPPETADIRAEHSWVCAPPAPGLEDRRVEISGPTDRKMVVNALNSGAKTFMADFEGMSLQATFLNTPSCHFSRRYLSHFHQPYHWSSQLVRCCSSPD